MSDEYCTGLQTDKITSGVPGRIFSTKSQGCERIYYKMFLISFIRLSECYNGTT